MPSEFEIQGVKPYERLPHPDESGPGRLLLKIVLRPKHWRDAASDNPAVPVAELNKAYEV
jgi:hypothetical protein